MEWQHLGPGTCSGRRRTGITPVSTQIPPSREGGTTTYLISEVPHSDAHTARHRLARVNDRLEVLLLLLEERRRLGERHADVELCDGNLEAERGELLHALDERRRDLADDEVALEANAVDRDALLLQRRHEVLQCGRFRA